MLQPLTAINCLFCLFVRTTATWLLALSAATSGKVIFSSYSPPLHFKILSVHEKN